MALKRGDRLDQYEIVTLIGEGGMGEVYRALDTKINSRPGGWQPQRRVRGGPPALAARNHAGGATFRSGGPIQRRHVGTAGQLRYGEGVARWTAGCG